ncbi:MAG: DUF3299 domain-containing protein [Pseudomonadota bacterium]|nr:DUF3299 domain-containing protein [Pseudomonadota bacterium]
MTHFIKRSTPILLSLALMLFSLLTACGEEPTTTPKPEQTLPEVASSTLTMNEPAPAHQSATAAENPSIAHTNEHDPEPEAKPEAKADTQSHLVDTQKKYIPIEWIELMPEEDLEALMNPPEYLATIEDGSDEDQITDQMKAGSAKPSAVPDDAYQRALVSKKVVKSMQGQAIRVPGFIVPLAFNDSQEVTEFFLVPFFGACIHFPPPPPNQIIYVRSPDGFLHEDMYTPFWISGVLEVDLTENETATSAYSMTLHKAQIYTEE